MLDLLAWLWDTIADPILTALGHTATPANGHPWPRIWWCPVGILAYLPVHAAGYHRDLAADDPAPAANPRTVLDRLISSYIPTVRALGYARSHPPTAATSDATLIIAVSDAPGTRPLAGVDAEANAIQALIPNTLRPQKPSHDEVLATLPTRPVVHFACHGLSDQTDPAASQLILPDHLTKPLTVADVTALHLTGALAYLSACDTATTSLRLLDEALHLTGAFHLVGYQNVIGTLWPIDDDAARRIAAHFYAYLTSNGTRPPETALSAQALHSAVRTLRAEFPTSPTFWAAHTHTGI